VPLTECYDDKMFVFGAGRPQPELYRVIMDLELFGQRVEMEVSVVAGEQTPFLLSKSQLSKWHAVIDVFNNRVKLVINGRQIMCICPPSSANLMILPLYKANSLRRSRLH